jgi:hypothetical protein
MREAFSTRIDEPVSSHGHVFVDIERLQVHHSPDNSALQVACTFSTNILTFFLTMQISMFKDGRAR